jgi:hypothetical protein
MFDADLLPRRVVIRSRPLACPLDAPAIPDFWFHSVVLYSIRLDRQGTLEQKEAQHKGWV